MIITFYRVCTKWSLPSTECVRNEHYFLLSVHQMIFILFWVYAEWSFHWVCTNDLYCTFFWVCTKWSLPSTECARNDLYLMLSVQEMIPNTECAPNDLYTECALNDLYLIRERKMIFTLHWAFGKLNDLYSYTPYKGNENFVGWIVQYVFPTSGINCS